ncbi:MULTISPECIES: ABC transporter permease [Acidobacterium]|uniref:ABC-type transport system, involved in lipoprotein release, permease components n=1 Tax=Acidobacterium capsulatum (strain ATCC 51196 / DSM 11244 / BCRC 80197 / JCM 7670 / NBRC 15755 / NCIMB 13165 / 161) TaxID=240015 RepID=C1F305_ACIC5|nr:MULTISPECIES: ABC transporter permease [Acidobacterium]ACO32056.1 ABC-type transport system, involved in lipoprotein release, permease components [Acidobacterium capsulatum ATCC 51196]HCT60146.1 ABC transporter permease [Acidobacterium sp.]
MQSFGDIFGQVFRAIWANKLRSFLTMFGIAWGVGSMLLLIGVGEGFRVGQRQQLSRFGSDVIMMWGGNVPAVPSQHVGMRPYYLTLRDEQAIVTQAPDVRDATAFLERGNLQEQSLYETITGTVDGVQINYPKVRNLPIAEGRFLSPSDELNRNNVAVLGQKSAIKLFPGHPALGSWVTLGGTRFLVIGVAQKIGHGDNNNLNQQVYIPLSVMRNKFPLKGDNIPTDAVTTIQYQPRSHAVHLAALAEVHTIIARRHGFDPNAPQAFNEWDTIQTVQMVDKIFDAMDTFLGGVGLVTLALGAVGIVNIMLVSVTERTREIGLRKAIGATSRSILMQFFLEGITLTGVSGLIGIGGATGFMWLLQKAIGQGVQGFAPPHVVPWTAALAFGSLTVCGVLSGIYPASRAAALEPVEALRKE